MPAFPIFKRLSVSRYGLYPGSAREPGLDVEFSSGLTLVLGANGLGKTTLVTMLYRMCSGPTDIRALTGGRELGWRNIEAGALQRPERRVFADRVVDQAEVASATLELALGGTDVVLTRSLENLELMTLSTGGKEIQNSDEDAYQQLILNLAGLSSFGDWILLLRHVTFYFEDRRALVWDPSAQRQILRMLFLAPQMAAEWTRMQREIVERDSLARNIQYALTRQQFELSGSEDAVGEGAIVVEELQTLQELQGIDEPRVETLTDELLVLEAALARARLNALQAEADHESAFRDLERQELAAIAMSFPDRDQTALYLLGKLFADGECLACGSKATDAVEGLRVRVQQQECVICGSAVPPAAPIVSFTSRSIQKATEGLERATVHRDAAQQERERAEAAFESALREVHTLNSAISDRAARIDALIKRLPPSETALHEQRTELSRIRANLFSLREELQTRRSEFADFIAGVNRRIVRRKTAVQETFHRYAKGFLLEDASLVWAPYPDRVGETGEQIDFPNFEIALAGAGFPSPVRRSGPDQASESQREFIDLGFRMTLMGVAGKGGVGSLVIDAPESSLDAVFVKRAADVLSRFGAARSGNRLVIASNLIEGDLIPELLRKARITSPDDKRVVDLLESAAPTEATRTLAKEYRAVRRKLFERAREKR